MNSKCGGPPFDIDITGGVGRDATSWGLLTEGRKRRGEEGGGAVGKRGDVGLREGRDPLNSVLL